MRGLQKVWLLSFLLVVALTAQSAMGGGFGVYQGSIRGAALGALTARADDPSALFYNAAGITQLEGTQVKGGLAVVTLMHDIETLTPVGKVNTTTERNYFPVPFLYGTYQVNDSVWAGLGVYSRFGLGTEYEETWPGRFNSYNSSVESLNFNPNIAVKLNDKLSVAAGVSAVWFENKAQRKIPVPAGELDFDLTVDGVGYGFNAGIRYELMERVALGASYQSTVKQELEGDTDIGVGKSGSSLDFKLPDMLALGVVVQPMDKLSVEVGAIQTGWSSYDELVYKVDNPMLLGFEETRIDKSWEDAWRYYAGLEFNLNQSWDLQLGYVYDETPIPNRTADYATPATDWHVFTIGCSYRWESWKLDLGYLYAIFEDGDIPARLADGVLESKAHNGYAHGAGVCLTKQL